MREHGRDVVLDRVEFDDQRGREQLVEDRRDRSVEGVGRAGILERTLTS
jgi:hypothetical protein